MIEIRHPHMYNNASIQEAYNKIYEKEGIQLRDSFYLWLINLLKPKPGEILVDISCGQGRLSFLAHKKGINSLGIDFSEDAIKKAKRQMRDVNLIIGDGEQLPLPNDYAENISHIGSLEHYIQPEAGMREISRILKPNGTACILLPNSYGLFGNILHVIKTGNVFDDGQPLQRYNTREGWSILLKKNGLVPYKIFKYDREWPRTFSDLVWYILHPIKLLRLILSWFIPTNLANCLVYLCNKELPNE